MEMKETQDIFDYAGNKIEVGVKVRYYEADPPPRNIGTVIEITDWDGDVDDDTGRSRIIEPDIIVKFPDGAIETYSTSEWEFSEGGVLIDKDGYPDGPEWVHAKGKVEELMVVKES